MSNLDALVENFLTQKKIAVVGVSDQRETGCNLAYRTFKERGYVVSAVNPRISEFEDAPCYPDLKSIPEKSDAVFILTNPNVTETVVQECVDLWIKHVWMHCMMGTKSGLTPGMTSVSQDAVRVCHENGIVLMLEGLPPAPISRPFMAVFLYWLVLLTPVLQFAGILWILRRSDHITARGVVLTVGAYLGVTLLHFSLALQRITLPSMLVYYPEIGYALVVVAASGIG